MLRSTEPLLEHDQWNTHEDERYGFLVEYPPDWTTSVTLVNDQKQPGVIEQRLLLQVQPGIGVNIDVFPNSSDLTLQDWFDSYQARFVPSDGIVQVGLVIAGEPAIYSLDLGGGTYPPRHTVVLVHNEYVYRVEYQDWAGGLYLDAYRRMLESLGFWDGVERPDELFDVGGVVPQLGGDVGINEQDCCGYHDTNYNPYSCYSGNCTWWARYKRPDTGGQSSPYWGNASYWTSRADEEGFTVNSTPATGALGGTPRSGYVRPGWSNHIAYVESFSGSTVNFSDMDYGEFNCSVDYWSQSSSA